MPESVNRTYDIVLVCVNFRWHPYYLNIVKELADTYSVCLYFVYDKKREKMKKTETLYINKCKEYGAHILKEGDKCSCNLLLLLQSFLVNQRLHMIKDIDYQKINLVQRLAHTKQIVGVTTLKENYVLGAKKLWIFNNDNFDSMIKQEKLEYVLDEIEISVVAFPYMKHPAIDFSHLDIDYIIAYPTQLFLKKKKNEMNLFCNMEKLLKSIPSEKNIYIKQHNVSDKGNRLSRSLSKSKLLFVFDFILSFMIMIKKKIFKREVKWNDAFHEYKINKIRKYIEKRARPLSDVTKYHNLNIEHFFPFVKEGVITGISSVIWNALLQEVPVYNCDDQPLSVDSPNYHIYKNFYVSPCNGELKFDPAYYDLVKNKEKKHNMIELLKREIGHV